MSIGRRGAMQVSLGALLCLATPLRAQDILAPPNSATLEDVIAAFSDGSSIRDGSVTVTLPEIAEDGYRVSVQVAAPEATEILLVAPGNPVMPVLKAKFGPMAGAARVSTRMRLAQTQDVLVLARMPDGSIQKGLKPVSVIVGGCA